jgi:hypothetical protein
MLAYFSYVALMFCLVLMFFLRLMWRSPQYLPQSTTLVKPYFWPNSALSDWIAMARSDNASIATAAMLRFASPADGEFGGMPGLPQSRQTNSPNNNKA